MPRSSRTGPRHRRHADRRRQVERAEHIQDRAEELQDRGMGIMKTARRSLAVVLPIVALLIAYLSWLLFRR